MVDSDAFVFVSYSQKKNSKLMIRHLPSRFGYNNTLRRGERRKLKM